MDIPSILDKLNKQTNFSDDQAQRENPGFADQLRNINQFRQGGGAGGQTAPPSSALRVTFSPEAFAQLAQETTLQAGFIFANNHLRAFLANEAGLATETTLAGIAETLNQIQFATEKTADSPLVQRLVDVGIGFPNNPQDPTNAAFTQSPIQDILGRGGLSLFAGFDAINSNLETLRNLQGLAEPTPDLSQMPGDSEGTPMYAHIVNQPQVQDVRLVGGVLDGVKDTLKTKVEGTVDVKQVGRCAGNTIGRMGHAVGIWSNDSCLCAGRFRASESLTGRYFYASRIDRCREPTQRCVQYCDLGRYWIVLSRALRWLTLTAKLRFCVSNSCPPRMAITSPCLFMTGPPLLPRETGALM